MKHHYGWIIILLGALLIGVTSYGQPQQRDEFIMMEIVSIKKPGLHFFKKGYKRGDKYWYFDGRRVKPLPKNWLVWEWRVIKD